jgi:GNAT superfamily N-acetyltransferase
LKPIMPTSSGIEFYPLTAERWDDLRHLFEGHGNPGYCWCTLWRLSSREYGDLDSAGRRKAMEAIVGAGTRVGILGYLDGEPVGWCSVAPRETYSRLERSRTIKRIDQKRTWSVVCFYLDRRLRGQSLTPEFLRVAVDYAASQGVEVVEGYPVEPEIDADGNWQPARSYRFMGYLSSYLKAGFVDVTPEGSRRKIVRYIISHDGEKG